MSGFEIHRPADLDGAAAVLAHERDVTILAGGTDVMVDVNSHRPQPRSVLALRDVAELQEWDGPRLGAMVTYRRMETGPYRALAQLSRTVGSPQIRNAGTIGGNLGTASPAGELCR